MSLIFIDGFDHYSTATEAARKWTVGGGVTCSSVGSGRGGVGRYVNFDSAADTLWKDYSNKSTIVLGFGWYTGYTGLNDPWLYIRDGGSNQIYLRKTNGYFYLYNGHNALLGITSEALPTTVWTYVEIKATIHNSAGAVEILFNGNSVLSVSGVDTSGSGNAYTNRMLFVGSNGQSFFLDDFYLLDTNGSFNNDYLGDVKVECLYSDGAGNSTQWTPVGEASNYLTVDENTPDDDSTYVTSSGTSELDLYTYDDISVGVAEVYGVQINPYARKDAAGEVTLDHYVRVNSTNYVVGSGAMSDNYNYYPVLLEESPDTATQWTLDEINALEVGVNRSE